MIRRAIARAAALTAILGLAGCVSIVDAPAGTYAVSPHYNVTLGREWSDITAIWIGRSANIRLLTIDGPSLNRLYITDGLAPGGSLVNASTKTSGTPTYRADMSPTELVEFVTDSVAGLDYLHVESQNLRPARFAGGDALRFDLTATTQGGLEMRGTALVAEHEGRLYLILYLAPAEHYFTATLQEVEGIMQSVRFAMLDLSPYARAEAGGLGVQGMVRAEVRRGMAGA